MSNAQTSLQSIITRFFDQLPFLKSNLFTSTKKPITKPQAKPAASKKGNTLSPAEQRPAHGRSWNSINIIAPWLNVITGLYLSFWLFTWCVKVSYTLSTAVTLGFIALANMIAMPGNHSAHSNGKQAGVYSLKHLSAPSLAAFTWLCTKSLDSFLKFATSLVGLRGGRFLLACRFALYAPISILGAFTSILYLNTDSVTIKPLSSYMKSFKSYCLSCAGISKASDKHRASVEDNSIALTCGLATLPWLLNIIPTAGRFAQIASPFNALIMILAGVQSVLSTPTLISKMNLPKLDASTLLSKAANFARFYNPTSNHSNAQTPSATAPAI